LGGGAREVSDGVKCKYKGHTPWPQCLFCQNPRPTHLPENCLGNPINKKTQEASTLRVAVASRVPEGGTCRKNMFGSVSNNLDCLSKDDVKSLDFDIKWLFIDAPQNDNYDKNDISTDTMSNHDPFWIGIRLRCNRHYRGSTGIHTFFSKDSLVGCPIKLISACGDD